MRERLAHLLAGTVIACALGVTPVPCVAQLGLPHIEDATVPPAGVLRLRTMAVWTRYDAVFTNGGTAPIGAFLTSDSLGAAQVPALGGIQSLVQNATAQPFKLTLGHSELGATAREEIIPIGFEYGVTRRFAVSLVTPIVRRRVAAVLRLDTAGFGANVGP